MAATVASGLTEDTMFEYLGLGSSAFPFEQLDYCAEFPSKLSFPITSSSFLRNGLDNNAFEALHSPSSHEGNSLSSHDSAVESDVGSTLASDLPERTSDVSESEMSQQPRSKRKRQASITYDSEEKRRRNCEASARFRQKKKQELNMLEDIATKKSEENERLQQKVKTLEAEIVYLKQLMSTFMAGSSVSPGYNMNMNTMNGNAVMPLPGLPSNMSLNMMGVPAAAPMFPAPRIAPRIPLMNQ
eukprot:Colp12_sorted_trinity150504_noHs@15744